MLSTVYASKPAMNKVQTNIRNMFDTTMSYLARAIVNQAATHDAPQPAGPTVLHAA